MQVSFCGFHICAPREHFGWVLLARVVRVGPSVHHTDRAFRVAGVSRLQNSAQRLKYQYVLFERRSNYVARISGALRFASGAPGRLPPRLLGDRCDPSSHCHHPLARCGAPLVRCPPQSDGRSVGRWPVELSKHIDSVLEGLLRSCCVPRCTLAIRTALARTSPRTVPLQMLRWYLIVGAHRLPTCRVRPFAQRFGPCASKPVRSCRGFIAF